jgi:lipopolysaccharide export system protein LptC
MMNAFRRTLDRLVLYLPAILMAVFALSSWWLVRSLPSFFNETTSPSVRHEPDYFLNYFSVKTFDSHGRLMRELSGEHAQHFPDTDTLDIQKVQLRGHSQEGQHVNAVADQALAKGDGSQVTLLGNVHISQPASTSPPGPRAATEMRSQEIKAFVKEERLVSNVPVEVRRGQDLFTAEKMQMNSKTGEYELNGRVRGSVHPKKP